MDTIRRLLAEGLGTFFLCFAGIGAILSTQEPISSGVGLVGIALAHGLALSVAVNAFGGISGAHFNPAVTMGFLSTGRITPPLAGMYVAAQLAGAVIAAAACSFIFPDSVEASAKLGIPLPPEGPNNWASEPVGVPVVLVTEFILTFLLMTAIFGTAMDDRGTAVKIGGFGIGLTVTFDILCAGTVTGASMNPARSFGPALVHGYFDWHWCYWVAPIAGAIAAALLYHHVLLPKNDDV
jgi:MIP family channel proteins